MDYRKACTNCGESNYHVESDISFISGNSGFHVCHGCGFTSRQFPKIAKVEIEMIKKRFSRHPKNFFKEEKGNSNLYFFVLVLLALLFVGLLFVRG